METIEQHVVYEYSFIFDEDMVDALLAAGFVRVGELEIFYHPDHWAPCGMDDEEAYSFYEVALRALSDEAQAWSGG